MYQKAIAALRSSPATLALSPRLQLLSPSAQLFPSLKFGVTRGPSQTIDLRLLLSQHCHRIENYKLE